MARLKRIDPKGRTVSVSITPATRMLWFFYLCTLLTFFGFGGSYFQGVSFGVAIGISLTLTLLRVRSIEVSYRECPDKIKEQIE